MLLPSALSAPLLAPRGLYAREDIVTTIVTTLAEESTTYVVVDGQTEETVVSGTPYVVEVPAAETTMSFEAYNTHTSVSAAVFSVDLPATTLDDAGKFTFSIDGSQVDATYSFVTTFLYPGTTLELSFSARQTAFHFTGEGSTEVIIPPEHTHVTVDGIETAVDIPGFTTTVAVTGSSNVIVDVPATTAQMTIPEATYVFSAITATVSKDSGNIYYCGTNTEKTLQAADGNTCVMGTIFTVTLPSDASALYLHAPGLTTSFALEGITTTFVPQQTITFVKDGSTETSVIPAVVSTYTTTISDTNVSSEESPTPMEPSVTEPGTTEPGSDFTVSQSIYTSDGSVYTTDVEVPITTPSATAPQPQTSANVPTAPAGSLNTACSVVLGPMSGEDVALLEVIFSGTIDGTTYAQWLVNYASQLTRQIDNVAAQALADSGRQYTTAFDTIDVTGILGLASAAPMYTCYLSSLWAEALRNPQQYAKRAAPTQDEKTKLIVLFERRDDNTGGYNLAELLVDETDDLIAEMNSVIGGQIANPSNYANLFTRLDVRQLLSLASEAPVYTSGLSAAMQTALASYMATAPVNRVTTEVITLDNGRVETRTVTVCVENCDTVVAQSTRRPAAVQTVTTRPNVAVYTQVQNGVTYTHTIEI